MDRRALGVGSQPGSIALLAACAWATGLATDCTCQRQRGLDKRQGPAVVLVDREEAQGMELREVEPNDDQSRAQPVVVGEAVSGSLRHGQGRDADQDWYSVKVDGTDQLLRADLSGVPGVDLRLEAFSAAGQWLVKVDNSRDSGGEVLLGLHVDKSTVFLRVSGRLAKGIDGKTLGRYRLAVGLRARDSGEEQEPNWKESLATAMGPEGEAVGRCGWRSDEDWYAFELSTEAQAQLLRVDFDAPDGVGPSLGLRVADGWIVEPRGVGAGKGLVLANLRRPVGNSTLYLVVRCGRSYDLDSHYALRVSTSPAGNSEVEPNDVPAAATLLPLGRRLNGVLADHRDRDLYRIPRGQPGVLRVVVDPPGGLDATLEVLGDDGAARMTVNAAPAGKREVLLWSGSGTESNAVVVVRAVRPGAGDPTGAYAIEARVLAGGDWEREPNDAAERASPWPERRQSVRGVLTSPEDSDWFSLPAGLSSTRLTLRFEGDLRPSIAVLGGEPMAVVASATVAAGQQTVALVASLESHQRYFVRVDHQEALATAPSVYHLSYQRAAGPAPVGPTPRAETR